MRNHGKGVGINITSEFTSTLNRYKQRYTETPPAPVLAFKPLVVQPHFRQAEIDAYRAMPSWKAEP